MPDQTPIPRPIRKGPENHRHLTCPDCDKTWRAHQVSNYEYHWRYTHDAPILTGRAEDDALVAEWGI